MPGAAISSPDSPSSDRRSTDALFREYRRSRDPATRDALVERFLPLARQLARRYQRGDEPFDDLVQVASLGLVKAVDRFDLDRAVAFSSYAVPTILGELKRYFRDKGWALHVPRDLQERALKAVRESERLAKQLGRSPSVREVAAAVGCSSEELLEAYEAASSYETASLDAPATRSERESIALIDLVGDDDDGFEAVADTELLAEAWRELPSPERRVLQLRFVHDMTQREIGDVIGYSQMHVSRLLRRALRHLEEATA
ncbi:MAG: SigB/SigF/SigG family RNA polymerase sigma factor [Solirubrobacteraceae bacterium]